MSFWKKLLGRSASAAEIQAEGTETPSERRIATEGVEGRAADELVEEQLGGIDPNRLVDDEFKP